MGFSFKTRAPCSLHVNIHIVSTYAMLVYLYNACDENIIYNSLARVKVNAFNVRPKTTLLLAVYTTTDDDA